ncbi:MAG TPA: nickel-dependent hydrogenase large subunit [Phycisphaerae bacterium]|nr:nickel-dependent hydrogenase large subunit [Phycisphaerae bacterium]
MSTTIAVSPVTRIEGHLAVHTETEEVDTGDTPIYRITEARCEGEMFRGLEQILRGRDPLDAQQITQRVCGVCPISHGIASVRAQEQAYGIKPSRNGRLLQNLIQGANYLQSHVLHFYHLAALDFVDVTAVLGYGGTDPTLKTVKAWVEGALARKEVFPAAPFLPRYECDYIKSADRNVTLVGHYVKALDLRRRCHEMAAVFGARLPHSTALIPGGCTQTPTLERVLAYTSRLKEVLSFIESTYIPDLIEAAAEFPQYFEIGGGYGNFLCYGVFDLDDSGNKFHRPGVVLDGKWEPLDVKQITEEVKHSSYVDIGARYPGEGDTQPQAGKPGAYSWIKAPRYKGQPMEVGALARIMVNYKAGDGGWVKKEVDGFCSSLNLSVDKLVSVLGRHVARGLESVWLAKQCFKWLEEIEVDTPATTDFTIPESGSGVGLTEAPRGALGHWLSIKDHHISNYQCVVPTTWNCSPRDAQGKPGPVEKALEGIEIKDPAQPIEMGRLVRSFDPCIACAVH